APVVSYGRGFAVHQPRRPHDGATEDLDDRLVAETDAEHRNAAREALDHAHRDTGVRRRAGSGRDAQVRRLDRLGLLDADAIVAVHPHVGAEHEECLHQVVGEGVVVVDQEKLRAHSPALAISSARRIAALFAITSSCSRSGWLSATNPAPAW